MQHHFRVTVRLKNVALSDQVGAQLGRVDQITVVTQGDLAVNTVNQYRLCVDDPAVASRRVPDMPNSDVAGHRVQESLVECLRNLPHGSGQTQPLSVCGGNASALLAAML